MKDTQLFNILNNIFNEKSEQLQNNELFNLVSIIVLLKIVDNFSTQTMPNLNTDSGEQVQSSDNLSGIINQLQGSLDQNSVDNSSMQQMLPLLMKLMGNKNMLNNLLNNLNSSGTANKSRKTNTDESNNQNEEEDDEDKKKRII
ncbi:MAG: hypothetical protein ACOCQA_03495 [bacterium]